MQTTQIWKYVTVIAICIPTSFAFGQAGGYEASWGAGIWGMNQNPAATTASVYRSEFSLGFLNMSAKNDRFQTNSFSDFFPAGLVRGLADLSDSQPFTTDLSQGSYSLVADPGREWNASTTNKFIGPGGYKRLDLEADWVERGLSRMAFSLWLERSEVFALNGIDESFVDPVIEGLASPNLGAYSADDNQFSIQYREWDALALAYGLSLGKGNKLFHIAIGGKLLSAGSYMDLQVYDAAIEQDASLATILSADSVSFAYNPSFEQGLGQGINRRFKDFEYSWGVEGNIGLIYQSLNYNREPVFEAGIGVQGIGAIQFWNLTSQTYGYDAEVVTPSDLLVSQPVVSEFDRVLSTTATSSVTKGPGVTERLPLSITAHAKQRINSALGLQLRAVTYQNYGSDAWQANLRATFTIERKGLSFYLPVSYQLGAIQNPTTGLYIAISNGLVIGSEDLLSNLYLSATRRGVTASNFFVGLHFPINKDY